MVVKKFGFDELADPSQSCTALKLDLARSGLKSIPSWKRVAAPRRASGSVA